MTRLQRARALANGWERNHRRPWTPETHVGCPWRFPDWPYTHMDGASLALDGYPAPHTRRKLPACTPVFAKGMPF